MFKVSLIAILGLFSINTISAQFLSVEPNSFAEDMFLMKSDMARNNQLQGLLLRDGNSTKTVLDKRYSLNDFVQSEIHENDSNNTLSRTVSLLSWKAGENRVLINPLLDVSVANYGDGLLQNNSRGLNVRTHLFGKLSAVANVLENQTYFTDYTNRYRDTFGVIPGNAFWKPFKTGGSDYFRAFGYISGNVFTSKSSSSYSHLTFGHFHQKFGKGIQSLFMGGNSPANLGLRLVTNINNKLSYTNYFGQMNGFTPLFGNTLLPKKYIATHRLGLNFGKNNQYNIGLFETVVHSRNGGLGGFDLDYLNPIIFYRSVESNLGSADNALVGLDLNYSSKWGEVYGQLVLDELKVSELKNDWWANKYGYQIGYRHVKELNDVYGHIAQIELNSIRPYTYGHYNPLNAYSHYNQSLAHPYGANLREITGRYKGVFPALKNTWVDIGFSHLTQGIDSFMGSSNMGSNFRLSNDTRISDYGIAMLQGKKNVITSVSIGIGKMFFHRVSVNLRYQYRNETAFSTKGNYLSLGIKYQIDDLRSIL